MIETAIFYVAIIIGGTWSIASWFTRIELYSPGYPEAWILDISSSIYSKSDVSAEQRKLRSSTHETQNEKEIQIVWVYIFDCLEKLFCHSEFIKNKKNFV